MTTATRKHLDKINDDCEFFNHQIEGVRQMARMQSFILADEMGLGKSLQALTVGAVDFQRGVCNRILVIGPNHLKWNWADEIAKFTSFTFTVLHGTPKQREKQLAEFCTDILICSYESLSSDAAMIAALGFQIMIVDEAHAIKDPKSKRSKAVTRFPINRAFMLTGSPVLNRPNELWALLHRCDPNRFKSYWAFVNRYCVFGGFKGKQVVGTKNKAELKEILAEYMIRRYKADVLDLPEKQVINIKVELHPEQRKVYDEADATLALSIPDDPDPMEIENALVKMLRLKQIAATPWTLGFPDDSYKLDKAMEMVDEFIHDPDHPTPVVIFTQFRGVMEAMRLRLDAADIPTWELNGSVKNEKRIPIVHEWSKHSEPGVLMVMLQMGTGLNLTAAKKAIFIDKLYVPKLNEQAEDRLHRIGTEATQPVQIFCLIAKDTVEDRIEKILATKRRLFKTVIDDVAKWKELLIQQLKEEAA